MEMERMSSSPSDQARQPQVCILGIHEVANDFRIVRHHLQIGDQQRDARWSRQPVVLAQTRDPGQRHVGRRDRPPSQAMLSVSGG
jgi:hypothetical protein